MKFSIVITTHNRLEFLKRAIASSLNQTVPCEVVVVDDASTDGTERYVRGLGDQVVYQRNSQNLNHAGSVNAGVQIATGDWIKFLDDDDYLAEDCIEKMQQAIARHPKAVICSCGSIQVDEQGNELKRTGLIGPSQTFFIPKEAIHYGMLLEQAPFGTPVQVASLRDAFLKADGWDTTMTTNYDDIDAWIRIAEHGDALFLSEPLAYRTLWSGGFEQKKDLHYRVDLNLTIKQRIYERVNEEYRAKCPSMKAISRYVRLHWGLVALLQRKWAIARTLSFPACLYPNVWSLFWRIRLTRRRASGGLVPKLKV
ncbi:glycosyltransferase family 2 protein [Oscillatoria sp. CS-180]|uniref:glycosyltransferase family 2 protein n=1 Tax=Oscillatoria sp. CS-180 TaxID=3021720 RepID=UPI002331520B|nr:glycosyltransferase family 2 protein [Oscillatoria sp. CS-180]MDB9525898.1 glycosyltransferase family 2 protein [Oscillatoria sp. CS-180]